MTLFLVHGGRLLRVFAVLFFYLFFVFVFGLVGLLFNLHYGFFVGIALAIIVLAIIFKYGEKFILLFAKARYVSDDENLVNQVKNFCTHLDIDEIKVYWSNVYFNNVYFVNSFWGTPSIIVGKEVYKQLSKNELNSLIYATILRIKSQESKYRSSINLVTLCLFWWVFLISNQFSKTQFKSITNVFLYPAFYLKKIFYQRADDTEYFDSKVFRHELLKRDYISALFKVNKMVLPRPLSIGAFVLNGLSHTFNVSDDVLFYILIQNETPIEDRIKQLSGKLQ